MMKAWVLESPGNLILKEIEIPVPGANEVLVRHDAFCICNGSDPEIYNGHEAYKTPLVFGHEASGRIVEMGKDVKGWKIGQRVCWWFTMGAFAEYSIVNTGADNVAMFPVPDVIGIEESPVLELAIASCRALMPFTDCGANKRLGILGLGPSGLIAVQYAKLLGFEHIWGWDLYPMRRELALSLGIDAVCNPSSPSFENDVLDLCEVDIALDMMGDEQLTNCTFTKLLRKVRGNGTVVSYGHPEHGRSFSPFVFQSRNLTMISPERNIPIIREKGRQLMDWTAEGKIKIRPLVTEVRTMEDLGASFECLLKNPSAQVKMVFTTSKEDKL